MVGCLVVGVGCARAVGLTGSLCFVSLPLCYFGGDDGFQVVVVCCEVVAIVVKVFFLFLFLFFFFLLLLLWGLILGWVLTLVVVVISFDCCTGGNWLLDFDMLVVAAMKNGCLWLSFGGS